MEQSAKDLNHKIIEARPMSHPYPLPLISQYSHPRRHPLHRRRPAPRPRAPPCRRRVPDPAPHGRTARPGAPAVLAALRPGRAEMRPQLSSSPLVVETLVRSLFSPSGLVTPAAPAGR